MPYEAVAYHFKAVVLGKLDRTVCIVPEISVFLGMDFLSLHAVFGHNGVKVIDYDLGFGGIPAPYGVYIHRRAYREILAKHILQCVSRTNF